MTINRKLAANLFIVFALSCVFAVNDVEAGSQVEITPPPGVNYFGGNVKALPNGNIVVTANLAAPPGQYYGAVYLYNGKTRALINTFSGQNVGSFITVLPSGNFLVHNYWWVDPATRRQGAITWCSGTVGCSGTISAENSLLGTAGDTSVLPNGNYLVRSGWNNGVGALTFCNGNTGCAGYVSAANSLVGTTTGDVDGWTTKLTNGNYVVNSRSWDNGSVVDAGAITWCSGATGCQGEISAANSLVGTQANDKIGIYGIEVLSNGNYVVMSREWDNGAIVNAGAATWGNGLGGTVGEVSATNSTIGTHAGDLVGYQVTPLTNGNYVVRSPSWDGGRGAATWGNGTGGTVGQVSAANSLIGTTAGDSVGDRVTALTNGNYVLNNYKWDNGKVVNAGAATWGNGTGGTVGEISAANSLVGTHAQDSVGNWILPLTNGNYVIASAVWDNGTLSDAGAATWGNGLGGTVGAISAANSLVGTATNDLLGNGVTTLTSGNYVVSTSRWDNGTVADAGAVTWGDGDTGTVGTVSPANSLVGTQAFDTVGDGYLVTLPNGHYVVSSPGWDNGAISAAGAVTWGNGSGGTVGAVSAANSLVGTHTNDVVGYEGMWVLSNGNYVVNSKQWNSQGAVGTHGAVTWGNGLGGTVGAVSEANSVIGTDNREHPAEHIVPLSNGNYLVRNRFWKNGTVNDAGAVTWCNGRGGTTGAVSAENSLVGTQSGDYVGGDTITVLPNGNYVVKSPYWKNGSISNAGAMTYGAGNGRMVGAISAENSILGSNGGDGGGFRFSYDAFNETLVVGSPYSNTVSIFNPTYTSVADGDWSAGETWNYGAFTELHDIYIPNGRTVDIDVIDAVSSLRIACTGAVTGAGSSAYIIGSIKKDFCSAGVFRYPAGTTNGFSPVDTNVTALGVNPSSLTVSATQNVHPALNANNSLKRFWTITETGDLTADLTFNYLDPTDISSAEQAYKLYRVAGGVPTQITPFILNAGANTVGTTGVSDFSEWAVGNVAFNVSVGGMVSTANGSGIRNVMVVLTDPDGVPRFAYTGSFGQYYFDNVPAGGTYTVSVSTKRYSFAQPVQEIEVNDNLNNVNFVAEP